MLRYVRGVAPLTAIRAAFGLSLLATPGAVLARTGAEVDRRTLPLARGLGARQLAEALLLRRRPGPRPLLAGAGVDLLHAASMLALALGSRRHRRTALTSAATASAFGLAGVWSARVARERAIRSPGR
jgi:hypothetical protein